MSIRGIARRFHHLLYRSRKTIFLVIIVIVITVVFNALIAIWLRRSYGIMLPSVGSFHVVGAEVYGGDIVFSNESSYIDWGIIQIGTSKNASFILRNISNVPTVLSFGVDDWQPKDLGAFVHVSWNYSGNQIEPNAVIPVSISIDSVASEEFIEYLITSRTTSFSFSLNIQAVEA